MSRDMESLQPTIALFATTFSLANPVGMSAPQQYISTFMAKLHARSGVNRMSLSDDRARLELAACYDTRQRRKLLDGVEKPV